MCAICDFKIEFGVGHPQALAVAVATRKAIEAGLLRQLETEEGALAQARLRMTAVDTLNGLQDRVQEALTVDDLLSLPDFYVLLIENETWGFFHATEDGFDPDIVPERPDVLSESVEVRSLVLVTSQVALQAWLDSEINTGQLNTESLLFIDGPAEQRDKLLSMLKASSMTAVSPTVAFG
ncbi:hypothetical protein [Paraburkholderia fynbosensis]|uniref:Uncharacterized protein n=1 Tax=Paraburkholderia fynbosensis TaxID=1200993 RepID=A0A6J5H5J7_9BURK|nr:hypothetical protein [Paraburkholderia fynbosensis]CAB3810798.1 hypothetical protein LMG27177_07475 [Paraburkholderia fynbosensis]